MSKTTITTNQETLYLSQRAAKAEAQRDELLAACKQEHSANVAILVVLREAHERLTDNDMMPPNHKLKTWLAKARVCLEHGSSEQTRAAIAAVEGRVN